uniref:Uncharacterized protein n=1 Tax=Micrurus lemniscatus lemniscatus TaxID=129467 RepID=A0A2D4J5Q7_MICLE
MHPGAHSFITEMFLFALCYWGKKKNPDTPACFIDKLIHSVIHQLHKELRFCVSHRVFCHQVVKPPFVSTDHSGSSRAIPGALPVTLASFCSQNLERKRSKLPWITYVKLHTSWIPKLC